MIKARDLNFRYPEGRTDAITSLDLDLPKGAFGLIESASGTGKSTFIELLLGFHKIDHGQLEVNGENVQRTNLSRHRQSIGVVSEPLELVPDRTVSENVALPLELSSVPAGAAKSKLVETLHRFGLDEIKHEFPSALSEGERRRTKLARALVNEPFLLLLDEPTLGLDPGTASAFWDLLFREHQRGMTILAAVSSLPSDSRFERCLRLQLAKG